MRTKPKKKVTFSRDDQDHSPKTKPLIDFENDSLENHTNWNTGTKAMRKKRRREQRPDSLEKKIKVTGADDSASIRASEFFQSSHYFIDQLKDQFCRRRDDGWFEMEEDARGSSDDEEEAGEASDVEKASSQADLNKVITNITKPYGRIKTDRFLSGKWLPEEHQRFLEALRLFGKDWPKVQEFVGTRSCKNVVSHGQKFLVKLMKFLNEDETISEMTLEQAEYFHGVLCKRAFRSKESYEQQKADRRRSVKLFEVTKVTRELCHRPNRPRTMSWDRALEIHSARGSQPTRGEPAFRGEGASENNRSALSRATKYEQWKEQILRTEDVSFHKSLGFSIKMQRSRRGGSQKSKICFKPSLKQKDEVNDDDSAASQGSKHMARFFVDDRYPSLSKHRILKKYFDLISSSLSTIENDIGSDEEDVDLIATIGDSTFKVPIGQSMESELTFLAYKANFLEQAFDKLPNLYKQMMGRIEKRMDENALSSLENKEDIMFSLFEDRTPDEIEALLDSKPKLEIRRRNGTQLNKVNLETCIPNFEHG